MWMNDSEIALSYKRASNPKTQIKILAELNLCSKAEIEEILIKAGEIRPKEKKKKVQEKTESDDIEGEQEMKIPECILQYAFDRLTDIEDSIEAHQKAIQELEGSYQEMVEFIGERKITDERNNTKGQV